MAIEDDEDPSLATIILAGVDKRLQNFYCCLPGKVLSYDSVKQRATVVIVTLHGRIDESGERVAERIKPIANVPIVFARLGGFHMTMPVNAGDRVALFFASSAIARWLVTGTDYIDSGTERRGTLSDAFAMPGLHPFPEALVAADVSTAHMLIGKNGVAHQPIALGDTVETRLDALESHRHNSPSTGGPTSEPLTVSAGVFTPVLTVGSIANPWGTSPSGPEVYPDPFPLPYKTGHCHVAFSPPDTSNHSLCPQYSMPAPAASSDCRSQTVKVTI